MSHQPVGCNCWTCSIGWSCEEPVCELLNCGCRVGCQCRRRPPCIADVLVSPTLPTASFWTVVASLFSAVSSCAMFLSWFSSHNRGTLLATVCSATCPSRSTSLTVFELFWIHSIVFVVLSLSGWHSQWSCCVSSRLLSPSSVSAQHTRQRSQSASEPWITCHLPIPITWSQMKWSKPKRRSQVDQNLRGFHRTAGQTNLLRLL